MSVNGTKGNTTQWDRNDGIQDCSVPDNAPSSKVQSRETRFCKNVTIDGDLIVKGNIIVNGNITCSGTITAPFFDGIAARANVASSLG